MYIIQRVKDSMYFGGWHNSKTRDNPSWTEVWSHLAPKLLMADEAVHECQAIEDQVWVIPVKFGVPTLGINFYADPNQ